MKKKLRNPTFGFKDMARMAQVEPGVLAHWLSRGIVEAGEIVQQGGRKLRRFRVDDAVHVVAVAALTRQGLDVRLAAKHWNSINRWASASGAAPYPIDFVAISAEKSVPAPATARLEQVAGHLGGQAFIIIDLRAIRKACEAVGAEIGIMLHRLEEEDHQ